MRPTKRASSNNQVLYNIDISNNNLFFFFGFPTESLRSHDQESPKLQRPVCCTLMLFAHLLDNQQLRFRMDDLPSELIHMIYAYLRPMELANLRLVSRRAVPISLQYMVPEVHLILAKDSFEQLKALAEHPIISKYVTSFFFEANKLHVAPRKIWEGLICIPLRHRYSAQELDHAFRKYGEFIQFQQDSTQVDRQEKEVAEAMRCFPNLKELTMATDWVLRSWTSKMQRTFEPTLCIAYETNGSANDMSKPLGV